MNVCIYYRAWEKGEDSHTLLALAVRQFLKTQGRFCPGDLSVCRDKKFGKPYIKELPGLSFSISHSGPWWSCAVSETEVGLDLQEVHSCRQEKIARRFFHPDEVKWLEKFGFDSFCRIWAYKESYVKYTGAGLLDGMDYFSAADPDTGALGVRDVYQTEITFQKDFWMVVTAEKAVTVSCLQLEG